MGHQLGGCIQTQKWPVNASAQSKKSWRQFGRAAKLRSEVIKEGWETGMDEPLRNGEGTFGPQGCRKGLIFWKSEFEVGI